MTGARRSVAVAWAAATLALSACSFSPLSHRIKIGEEPFILFVGEGLDHHTDLFASPASGGTVSQVTFTPLIEASPKLTPAGDVVAFLRMRDTLPGTPRTVVMMNLLSGGELTIPMPAGSGTPEAVDWSADASTLFIRTDRGIWQTATTPTAISVSAARPSTADSAFATWLGRTRFARAIGCGAGVCVIGARGDTLPLAPAGTDPLRWGPDSVAWFDGNSIVVRSVGPGRERRVTWHDGPTHPRDASYAAAVTPPHDSL